MKKMLLTAALAAAVAGTSATASAQQRQKRDPDVNKTLQRAYPGAQTEVQGVEEINGVKVHNVSVKDKGGASSTAQVTEFGDFLSYGVPQQSPQLTKEITEHVGQLFQSKPSDIQLFRKTHYLVDVPVQSKSGRGKQQAYQIVLDPVGRVLDIRDAAEAEAAKMASAEVLKDEKLAKQLEQMARERYLGAESKLQRLSVSKVPDYYEVDIGASAVTLNKEGQVLQTREDVPGKDLPLPVRQAVDQLVKSSLRAQRVEEEYFQFMQQSGTGNQVVVKMRPDGNIIDVTNQQAQQEEQAVTAKHKQGAAGKGGAGTGANAGGEGDAAGAAGAKQKPANPNAPAGAADRAAQRARDQAK